ncbi:MAG: hypothetical protein A2921_00995 [Candidatus Magasanikbacteria bacterium RIFCSPLOWO2_01_FULL_43_20b]|uniref:Uncharacterized protein n=1 Tax=Candidatus Magasanikbacteria bacterium RIFCSPLOWO2_12_FULL_43_12 TaxID=1798692 RepID=A0A1F6MQJ9_9BACT|nr:MAG: hypothetical protein A3C74_02350 [Candidatus Magasanikbacteria bacterium RIFCSPHIGHO2_02_FULL_44_13]OGH72200.1 MAG: hypothetical protein A3I93_03330 [Candidatus Magasanikbacteria bacterium RIFCSPLOWO2_02_FULL_43_22]OGH73120.1 MAG: hypothetical protein A2921_00995 [Candidatus Magasanikbacteria bacterium RIFCSPLOWO2_01_FULL_43_20b]OGH73941.1 MAG: hypothetical protein A3G00_03480 [Candidatus Magasanikbacteria bacterium RIFCSPLOWO2_12_FULL_43_12]
MFFEVFLYFVLVALGFGGFCGFILCTITASRSSFRNKLFLFGGLLVFIGVYGLLSRTLIYTGIGYNDSVRVNKAYHQIQTVYFILLCVIIYFTSFAIGLFIKKRRQASIYCAVLVVGILGMSIFPLMYKKAYIISLDSEHNVEIYYAIHPKTIRWQLSEVRIEDQEYYWRYPWCEPYYDGNEKKALKILQRLAAKQGWSVSRRVNTALGFLYEEIGEAEKAEDVLSNNLGGMLIANTLWVGTNWYEAGAAIQFFIKHGRFDKIDSFSQSGVDILNYWIAQGFERNGLIKESEVYWLRSDDYFLERARFYAKYGEMDKVVKTYNAYKQSDSPDEISADDLYWFGNLLYALGDKNLADDAIDMAIKIGLSEYEQQTYNEHKISLEEAMEGYDLFNYNIGTTNGPFICS